MRSATPKVLHPLCGRPMLLHVVDALVALPLERIVVVVGHGAERVTKTLQEQLASDMPIEFVEQRVPTRHRRRGQRGAHRLRLRPRPRGRPARRARRRPAPAARDARPARPRAPPGRRRRHAAHRRVADPTGYGRIVRDEKGRVDHIVEQTDADRRRARDRRGEHVDLLLPPRPARAGAAAAEPRERAGRVLPDRRRGGAAPGRARRPRRRGRGPHRRRFTSTTGPSSPRPRRSSGPASTHRWMREGVTMVDPARTYVDTTVELEPDVRLLPGTILEGRTVIGRGLGDRPRHPARRHHRRRATRSSARPSPATPRSATTAPSARTCRCGPAPGSPPARTSARSSR